MTETLLVINGIALPAGSARGLTQTLEPISQASQLRRTVNGVLEDLSLAQFRKYKSRITGRDQRPPALDGIWPGKQVVVDCIKELWFVTGSGGPARTVVPGSEHSEGIFTFYRPRLTMRLMPFSQEREEWEAGEAWSIELEEI
jgi:hypothetical protein